MFFTLFVNAAIKKYEKKIFLKIDNLLLFVLLSKQTREYEHFLIENFF